ncbi:MAG TPA: CBS domain-containing protein, partial [Candidatus Binataceae bacterium]|nr:CBS domain-containing protein [Candidatus Binataceae bacterium]
LPIMITAIDRAERIDRVIGALREIAPNALMAVQEVEVVNSGVPFKEGLPDVNVSEVMRRDVVSVGPDAPLTRVVELLLDKDFTAVPVVDGDNKVVGMVSGNDLLTRGGMTVNLSFKRATDADFVGDLHKALRQSSAKVEDVMTREVVTTSPEVPLGRAARLMVSRHLKRLPVVDDQGRLVGILGRLDILNTLAAVHMPEWHPQAYSDGPRAKVADVMTRDVPVVHESATLAEIFDLLVSSAQKRVVVVDDRRRVAGIIADSDLISRVSREYWPTLVEALASKAPIERISEPARTHLRKLRARSAKELMTQPVVTVPEETPVASALALSAERRVKRLPVVDASGTLVGIVGRAEMMRALLA